MKIYLDCFPCFLHQALRAGRLATDNEKTIKRILDEVGMMFKDIPPDATPPHIAKLFYRKIREITGISDPYKAIKKESTQKALALYPGLKKRVSASDDRLLTAVRIAIAGNVIDFGANWDFDLHTEVNEILEKDFAILDLEAFKNRLDASREVLYIGDNAGECVFDRILIEEMKKPVTYAVRHAPIINDATREDAVEAGLAKVATIISSGTEAPGAILETCSAEFREAFQHSSFIISKGQGNYEALSNEPGPIFFLLKAKCQVIADDIGVDKGDIVLKSNRSCS